MTLPPLPEPDTHCFDDDTGLDVWSHSPDQMHAYGEACAAAERERLTTDCAGLRLALNRAESRIQELLVTTQGEPVAWRSKTRINNDFDSNWCLTSTEPPQTPRTIAIEPLYTHPPQQRKPLMHMQIVMMWGHRSDGPDTSEIVSFARAVERAHGIVEAP